MGYVVGPPWRTVQHFLLRHVTSCWLRMWVHHHNTKYSSIICVVVDIAQHIFLKATMVRQHTNSLDVWQCSQKIRNIDFLQNVTQHWYSENTQLLFHFKNIELVHLSWYKGCHGYTVVSAAGCCGPSNLHCTCEGVCVCVKEMLILKEWMDDGWMDGKRQTAESRGSTVYIFLSQLVKVHDNTETTSQDHHLLIHRYRIYRRQENSQRHRVLVHWPN